MSHEGFCSPLGIIRRLCFSLSVSSNELFETCKPSGGWGVWVLQRVDYVTRHFCKKQSYVIKAVMVVLEQFKLAK